MRFTYGSLRRPASRSPLKLEPCGRPLNEDFDDRPYRSRRGRWFLAALRADLRHADLPSCRKRQDVPGIEICTVPRRPWSGAPAAWQSNVDFLQKTIVKLSIDHQQKLDAAQPARFEGLKGRGRASLQTIVEDLQAAGEEDGRGSQEGESRKAAPAGQGCAEPAKEGTEVSGALSVSLPTRVQYIFNKRCVHARPCAGHPRVFKLRPPKERRGWPGDIGERKRTPSLLGRLCPAMTGEC